MLCASLIGWITEPTDTVTVEVISRFDPDVPSQMIHLNTEEDFGKVNIEITKPGVYEILVMRQDADGNLVSQYSIYKSFSYSSEYNVLTDTEVYAEKLSGLAQAGEGFVLTEPYEVFENVVKYIHKIYDPRILFITIALVAFLLDVAVRKFKFKWPHEILRDILGKKNDKKQ